MGFDSSAVSQVVLLKGLGNGSNHHLIPKPGSFDQSREQAASIVCPPCPACGKASSTGNSAELASAIGQLALVWPALSFNEVNDSNPLWRIFQDYTEGLIVSPLLMSFTKTLCGLWLPPVKTVHYLRLIVQYLLHRSINGFPTYLYITGANN